MADGVEVADTVRDRSGRSTGRLKWTNEMNRDLFKCKKEAQMLVASDDPPRNTDGRKKGYMKVMQELWNGKGYAGLNLSCQNLRDKAAHLERTLGNVRDKILTSLGGRASKQVQGDLICDFRAEMNVERLNQDTEADLHTSSSQVPGENAETTELTQLTLPILASVTQVSGEFKERCYDTRTKQRPNNKDIANVNAAVREIIKQRSVPDPVENPFGFLWLVNCIVYSVIIAFYISKGWKKQQGGRDQMRRPNWSSKAREHFQAKAQAIHGKLSKAKAELERLRSNGKLTKKGKRNHTQLTKECRSLSIACLVSYMEKEKAKLRKLKRSYKGKVKHEEARKLSKQFHLDAGRVYSNFKKIIEKQKGCENPTYDAGVMDDGNGKTLFGRVEEATEFWKSLWESEGTGDTSAKWLEEIRSAINERVPEPSDDAFQLSTEQANNVIMKKQNWSTPGPDQIVNFWWKKVNCVHEGVAKSFQAIACSDQEVPLWFTEGKTSLIPKTGEFLSENQRPFTCLNTI